MKVISRPDGIMLYGKMGVDFSVTFELLSPILKVTIGLIRATSIFQKITYNSIVSLDFLIAVVFLHNRRIALKDDYQKGGLIDHFSERELFENTSKDFLFSFRRKLAH